MINFFYETKFKISSENSFKKWLKSILITCQKKNHEINYIFCDDAYLLSINQKHLSHDNYTDIITFDYSEKNFFNADIYISLERIQENAKELSESFDKELKRVMIHGILHMIGYLDKTSEEKKIMREKEDFYIALFPEKKQNSST